MLNVTESDVKNLEEMMNGFSALVRVGQEFLNNLKFKDTVAHLLKEIMDGIDMARGKKKGEKAEWSREEVISLINAIKPTIKNQ